LEAIEKEKIMLNLTLLKYVVRIMELLQGHGFFGRVLTVQALFYHRVTCYLRYGASYCNNQGTRYIYNAVGTGLIVCWFTDYLKCYVGVRG
jgi:hypothetical protein